MDEKPDHFWLYAKWAVVALLLAIHLTMSAAPVASQSLGLGIIVIVTGILARVVGHWQEPK